MYIKTLEYSLQILKEKTRYHDIISICEDAMQYDFYEETIHIYFLDALMTIGQKRYALSHYEFYTTKFYHDLGAAPSSESKQIYKQLYMEEEKKDEIIDLEIIKDELEEDNPKGALICDPDYFKFLYKFEIRSRERNKYASIHLGIITIDNIGYKSLKEVEIKEAMGSLKNIMFNTLRKGDVLSQWNDSQLVFILYNVEEANLNNIIKRLETNFETEKTNPKVILNIKCKKI